MFTLKRFEAFVTSKGDGEIDHTFDDNGGAWCNCAVGAFLRHDLPSTHHFLEDYDRLSAEIANKLPEAHSLLNVHRPRTYAQLLESI